MLPVRCWPGQREGRRYRAGSQLQNGEVESFFTVKKFWMTIQCQFMNTDSSWVKNLLFYSLLTSDISDSWSWTYGCKIGIFLFLWWWVETSTTIHCVCLEGLDARRLGEISLRWCYRGPGRVRTWELKSMMDRSWIGKEVRKFLESL